jgi:hypothetical protein
MAGANTADDEYQKWDYTSAATAITAETHLLQVRAERMTYRLTMGRKYGTATGRRPLPSAWRRSLILASTRRERARLLPTDSFQISIQSKLRGAGGARTHDRRIMRNPARHSGRCLHGYHGAVPPMALIALFAPMAGPRTGPRLTTPLADTDYTTLLKARGRPRVVALTISMYGHLS